jgi:hypothetical protein
MLQVLELLGFMIQSVIVLTLLAAVLILFAGIVVMIPAAIGLLVYCGLTRLGSRRHGPVNQKYPLRREHELPSLVRQRALRRDAKQALRSEKKAA